MRILLALLFSISLFAQRIPGPGGAVIGAAGPAFVSGTCNILGQNGGTTSAINTSGSNFLIAVVSPYTPGAGSVTISDSNGNSWTKLSVYSLSPNTVFTYYSTPSTVGASHTVTLGGANTYTSVCFAAFSGMVASSVFQAGTDSGAENAGTGNVQPGSITPSGSTLVITGLGTESTAAVSVGSGFTLIGQTAGSSGVNEGVAAAYLIQASGSAINPTWTVGSFQASANIAAFKGL